jgi:hypothetical protein
LDSPPIRGAFDAVQGGEKFRRQHTWQDEVALLVELAAVGSGQHKG